MAAELINFRCNVCGEQAQAPRSAFGREDPSCGHCGSTVRMRGVIHHVSMALYGKSMPIGEMPVHPEIRGIGLSDWDGYALRVPHRVHYTNTFYHAEPLLDITKVPDEMAGTCDFVISTDVFEHVAPPVSRAFDGALRLLKPGGTLILTVPFRMNGRHTQEHFPHLHHYVIEAKPDGGHRLINTRETGEVETFDDIIFHGGPGTTLEMRVFTRDSLKAELRRAGFTNIRFDDRPVPEFGIEWEVPWSVPVTAQAPDGEGWVAFLRRLMRKASYTRR